MAGGAGFMLDMNSKLKENRALLKREKYHEQLQELIYAKHGLEVDIKNISEYEMLEFHNKVIKARKKDLYKRLGILSFSLIITAFMVYGLLQLL